MKRTLLTIAFVCCIMIAFGETSYKCTLKGEVINRESKTLYLMKATDNDLANKQVINIRDHKFEFTFDVQQTEAYVLIFADEYESDARAWRPITFFPAVGEINFKLYPMLEADKNEIDGSLNKEYANYNLSKANTFGARNKELENKRSDLDKAHSYRSAARDSLIKLTRADHIKVDPLVWKKLSEMEKTGEAYTPKGRELNIQFKTLNTDITKWKYNYIDNNPTIVSYYLIMRDAIYNAKTDPLILDDIKNAYPKFAKLYPSNSYTLAIANILDGFKMKVGDPLLDVSLPDLSGKQHSLSELANGKIMLIDFWGSWCSPCIANTRTMVPLYKEFKDKGFTIVGIAKEYKDTKELRSRLNKDKYAWLNLVELDDRNGVWNKFGITNSAGMMLLVDKDGKIISVDPTAAEVKKELTARL